MRLDRQYLLDPTRPVDRPERTFQLTRTKSIAAAYALLLFFGPFGAHRSYVGRHGSALTLFLLTAVGATLVWVPLDHLPVLDRLAQLVVLAHIGYGALALVALCWFLDLFRTAGMVRAANRRALTAQGPRTYYRGWPSA